MKINKPVENNKYYVLEIDYIGPDPKSNENIDEHRIYVSTEPGRANMSGEVRHWGWLGNTNCWWEAAHGVYDSEAEAVEYIKNNFEASEIFNDHHCVHDDELVREFRPGKFEPMGYLDAESYIWDAMTDDITQDTTDSELESLAIEYEELLNDEGFTIKSVCYEILEDNRTYCEVVKNA